MALKVSARPLAPGVFRITLGGDLDCSSADVLRSAVDRLLSQGCRGLLLDMGGVGFLDSSGLGVLLRILKDMRVRGGPLVLTGLTSRLRDLFRITGTGTMFDFVEDPAEAERHVLQARVGSNGDYS